jgi:hypothetical protein
LLQQHHARMGRELTFKLSFQAHCPGSRFKHVVLAFTSSTLFWLSFQAHCFGSHFKCVVLAPTSSSLEL